MAEFVRGSCKIGLDATIFALLVSEVPAVVGIAPSLETELGLKLLALLCLCKNRPWGSLAESERRARCGCTGRKRCGLTRTSGACLKFGNRPISF